MNGEEAKRLKAEIDELKSDFRRDIVDLKGEIKMIGGALAKNNELFFKASEQMAAIKNFAHHDLQEIKATLKNLKCGKESERLVVVEENLRSLKKKVDENADENRKQNARFYGILMKSIGAATFILFTAAAGWIFTNVKFS